MEDFYLREGNFTGRREISDGASETSERILEVSCVQYFAYLPQKPVKPPSLRPFSHAGSQNALEKVQRTYEPESDRECGRFHLCDQQPMQ